jgi:hypothetical protein
LEGFERSLGKLREKRGEVIKGGTSLGCFVTSVPTSSIARRSGYLELRNQSQLHRALKLRRFSDVTGRVRSDQKRRGGEKEYMFCGNTSLARRAVRGIVIETI